MSEELNRENPFAPSTVVESESVETKRVVASTWIMSLEWTAVLLFNLIAPLLIGWGVTDLAARFGVASAVVLVLGTGILFCQLYPLLMLFTIRGAVLVGLTQVIPVLHFIIGVFSVAFLTLSGVFPPDQLPPKIAVGFKSGFFLTLVMGSQLLALSLVIGLLMRLVTPDRWWLAKDRN
jgi:hypothetical protein